MGLMVLFAVILYSMLDLDVYYGYIVYIFSYDYFFTYQLCSIENHFLS